MTDQEELFAAQRKKSARGILDGGRRSRVQQGWAFSRRFCVLLLAIGGAGNFIYHLHILQQESELAETSIINETFASVTRF
ncbi:hypothetical protein CYMTET_13358 [Cymbomonas tetramitiformis]|uniref:Uncharacterized protein n=1 Tax=Cymbomonas tetramitiformis TaxID=36881 RepID=A0AAE0GJU2_9CHLO|nr:hypothetical protein CYMTET_13358 [Cymbomonas tetramitiformis]